LTTHLTIRLAWHDRGWDGHVCNSPHLNSSCVQQKNIRLDRDTDKERGVAGTHFADLKGWLPPCSRDPGAYAARGYPFVHGDPLQRAFLQPTIEFLPPYSSFASPYRWMREENFREVCESEEIALRGPTNPKKARGWIEEPDRQNVLLGHFWKKIQPGESLVFYYCNDGNPVDELSKRLIVGVGRIKELGQQLFFNSRTEKNRYPIWERRITQKYPEEGFRIPYQEYLALGLDPRTIACEIPEGAMINFSYVAEWVNDDIAVGVIERLIQCVEQVIVNGKVPGRWAQHLEWLNDVLAEVWSGRGAWPGAGSVLQSLGFRRGTAYQREILAPASGSGAGTWQETLEILEGSREPAHATYRDGLIRARNSWQRLPEKRRLLLKCLSRFELDPGQMARLADSSRRSDCGISASDEELTGNPYLLFEYDQGTRDSPRVTLDTIDRGMFPEGEALATIPDAERFAGDDRRRVRATLISVLRTAAGRGDTFVSLDEALRRVRQKFPQHRECFPSRELMLGDQPFFESQIAFSSDGFPRIALKDLASFEREVRDALIKRVGRGRFLKLPEVDWAKILEARLGRGKGTQLLPAAEERAREEKISALELMYRNRFSVLTGRAGTGKTSVIQVLLDGLEQSQGKRSTLLLAPTGKARVRLSTKTKRNAYTIHQYLLKHGWFDPERFSLRYTEGKQDSSATVIIDEASMVPMDLFGVLFRALDLNKVERLILVGDTNQLPPIGPGRPFVDIVSWLEVDSERASHLARLSERARHESHDSRALRLADGYLRDSPSPGDDEMLSAVSRGESLGDLEVHFWNDVLELNELLHNALIHHLGLKEGDQLYEDFNRSLGAGSGTWNAEAAESWQIISPTRIHPTGTTELNRVIQERFKSGLLGGEWSRPFGDQQIVWTDKVIQVVNRSAEAWPRGQGLDYVANGEIGIVTRTAKPQTSLEVTFSTQKEVRYTYFRGQVDDNLELAYALTVHKAQGSDFDVVFFVLPIAAATLSRELLYTGLTRFRKKLVLFLEKDTTTLEAVRKADTSDTLQRNTELFQLYGRPEDASVPFPGSLIHRTSTGVLVRSKSELVIAEVLKELGISYDYEKRLPNPSNPRDFRLPDFTVSYQGDVFYWEHLGMMEVPSYRESWERKKNWYQENGFADQLIVSQDGPHGEIDAREIERLARDRILGL
jgi:exodeoxyribonuclease V alpha subunit